MKLKKVMYPSFTCHRWAPVQTNVRFDFLRDAARRLHRSAVTGEPPSGHSDQGTVAGRHHRGSRPSGRSYRGLQPPRRCHLGHSHWASWPPWHCHLVRSHRGSWPPGRDCRGSWLSGYGHWALWTPRCHLHGMVAWGHGFRGIATMGPGFGQGAIAGPSGHRHREGTKEERECR